MNKISHNNSEYVGTLLPIPPFGTIKFIVGDSSNMADDGNLIIKGLVSRWEGIWERLKCWPDESIVWYVNNPWEFEIESMWGGWCNMLKVRDNHGVVRTSDDVLEVGIELMQEMFLELHFDIVSWEILYCSLGH